MQIKKERETTVEIASIVFAVLFIVGVVLYLFHWIDSFDLFESTPDTPLTPEEKKRNEYKSKYKSEALDAQITCNSVIPKKFGHILKHYSPNKNILLGYKDHEIGQIGFKGSGKKEANLLDKNVKFRWTWSLDNGQFIKCLILKDDTYKITLETY